MWPNARGIRCLVAECHIICYTSMACLFLSIWLNQASRFWLMLREAITDISAALLALLNSHSMPMNVARLNSCFSKELLIVLTTSYRALSTDFPLTYACCPNSIGICRMIRSSQTLSTIYSSENINLTTLSGHRHYIQ